MQHPVGRRTPHFVRYQKHGPKIMISLPATPAGSIRGCDGEKSIAASEAPAVRGPRPHAHEGPGQECPAGFFDWAPCAPPPCWACCSPGAGVYTGLPWGSLGCGVGADFSLLLLCVFQKFCLVSHSICGQNDNNHKYHLEKTGLAEGFCSLVSFGTHRGSGGGWWELRGAAGHRVGGGSHGARGRCRASTGEGVPSPLVSAGT